MMTDEGRARLNEGGMEGAYLGEDGEVHIPGKRVTLYSEPSPPQPSNDQQVLPLVTHVRITKLLIAWLRNTSKAPPVPLYSVWHC